MDYAERAVRLHTRVFLYYVPLCLDAVTSYYARNYASIIRQCLIMRCAVVFAYTKYAVKCTGVGVTSVLKNLLVLFQLNKRCMNRSVKSYCLIPNTVAYGTADASYV